MTDVVCATESDTRALAGRLASLVRPGDVLVLSGPLGCGKTVFASGLAEGLGIAGPVASPSFVLMRSYHDGFVPFVHVDVYRLSSIAEFEDLGVFDEGRDGVVVIEWGEAVAAALPQDVLKVEISIEEDGSRRIRFKPLGSWTTRPLEEVTG